MPHRWTKDFSFVSAAFSTKGIVVVLTSDEAAGKMEDLTLVASWHDRRWHVLDEAYLWSVVDGISVNAPSATAVFLGMSGEVLFTDGHQATEDSIAPSSDERPPNRGPMCGFGVIDDVLYAVGMGRQVYQRDLNAQWACLDRPIRPALDDDSIVGLNSIDGFTRNEIYSVGFNGEIWWQDADRWVRVDSPTNLPLTRIFCDGNERAYVCGRNGTLLVGRRNKWSFVAQDETDDDLWSIARYRDRLYILGTQGLYFLEGGALTPTPIAGESLGFCQHLLLGDNRLWLIGPKDLLSYDGNRWERID